MPDRPAHPTWEEVLGAVEADLARSEQLVERPSSPSVLAPAETRLPAAPALPPLASMPPVPRHLADRITAARERVTRLQEALHAELAALEELRTEQVGFAVRAARFASSPPAAGAAFFDSRV